MSKYALNRDKTQTMHTQISQDKLDNYLAQLQLEGGEKSLYDFIRKGKEGHFGKYMRYKLEGLDLREADFTGADLNNIILTGANFTGAIVANVTFGKAKETDGSTNLSRAVFEGCDLSNQRFAGANLHRANFKYAAFGENTKAFENATDLSHADFSGRISKRTNLAKMDFSGVNLEEADFRYADLTDAIFSNSNINRAKFDHALLEGADFEDSIGFKTASILRAQGLTPPSHLKDNSPDIEARAQSSFSRNTSRNSIEARSSYSDEENSPAAERKTSCCSIL